MLTFTFPKKGKIMTLHQYTDACIEFAKDTKKWGELDPHRFYTTASSAMWRETSDNSHGGIDVSWAFHKSSNSIKQEAPEQYIRHLLEDLTILAEETGFDDLTFLLGKYQ